MALLQQNKVSAMVQEIIELEQVPDALIRLSQRHVRGKIVAKL